MSGWGGGLVVGLILGLLVGALIPAHQAARAPPGPPPVRAPDWSLTVRDGGRPPHVVEIRGRDDVVEEVLGSETVRIMQASSDKDTVIDQLKVQIAGLEGERDWLRAHALREHEK